MRQDDRAPFAEALDLARVAAYPAGEYVGQESFMVASEILELARRAGVAPGVRVLDLCCGIAGPGRLVVETFGCTYLGVDYSAGALDIARARTGHLTCRFEVGQVPPVPSGPFDVVLLLETLLAFEDKRTLVEAIAAALVPGGRLAVTLEEGAPLTIAERRAMPDADTVHLMPLPELTRLLADAGLQVIWKRDCTTGHREVARSLLQGYAAVADHATPVIGERAMTELLRAHQLWDDWMSTGRVRKFALVAQTPRDHANLS